MEQSKIGREKQRTVPSLKPNKRRCENPNFRCYGKVIYRTPKQAEGEARYTKIKGLWGGAEHPYFCKDCHAWHLTSEAKRWNKNYGRNKSNRRNHEAQRRRNNRLSGKDDFFDEKHLH